MATIKPSPDLVGRFRRARKHILVHGLSNRWVLGQAIQKVGLPINMITANALLGKGYANAPTDMEWVLTHTAEQMAAEYTSEERRFYETYS